MRYWDSSAIMPLVVQESQSASMLALINTDAAIATWWGTKVACVSALARLEREQALDVRSMRAALARLEALSQTWVEIPALEDVRTHATRLLRTHSLRAADALQLAAAVIASNFEPPSLLFVTLDQRLGDSAEREGFTVLDG
ncbi:MAG: PIN domain-containing protein [Gemmatimonadaceae bacterium]